MKRCVSCDMSLENDTSWNCPNCGSTPGSVEGFRYFGTAAKPEKPLEFDDVTFRRMADMEVRSFYFRARRSIVLWLLEKHFGGMKKYLDFGCGTGFLFKSVQDRWPALEASGSDLSVDSLRATQARFETRQDLFCCMAEDLPFRDHFDAVATLDVVEHIDDDEGALRAMRSAIRPGGGILVSAPQHMVLWSRLDDDTGHRRRYVGDQLARTVERAGFTIEFDACFMASLFLPQYISRRFFSNKDETKFEDEHSLPGLVNGGLRTILEAELQVIKLGIRPGFGGTRYVVGRRT